MITRTTLLGGPAAAVFAGHTFFARDGILVSSALDLEAVDSDTQGVLDETGSQIPVTIRFVPSAPFADVKALYPHVDGTPGKSLFGVMDTPLVLVAANGVRLTFAAVAITGMPDLHLTSRGAVNGAVTFTALGAVSVDTADVPLLPTGAPQLEDDFVISWGAAPWADLRSRDGVKIRFALETKAVLSDANAVLDLTLERLEVAARFTPAAPGGPGEADLVAALQLGYRLPGQLASGGARVLEIAGEGLGVQLPLAQLVRGEMAFDALRPRMGELVFVSERAALTEALVTLGDGAL